MKTINMLGLMKRVSKVAVKLCLGSMMFLANQETEAAQYVWKGTASSDLTDPSNWTPNTVPGANDTGIFSAVASNTNPTLNSETTVVGAYKFQGATDFIFDLTNGAGLSFEQAGIINGGSSQTFNLNDSTGSVMNFDNNSSANATRLGSVVLNGQGATFNFHNNSSASSSTINANNTTTVNFYDDSSASSSTLNCSSSSINFNDSSTAASSTIFASNGTSVAFFDSSTASSVTINANDSTVRLETESGVVGGTIKLQNDSELRVLNSVTIGPVTCDPSSNLYIQSSTLTIKSNKNTTIAGPISDDGNGSLIKTGNGTLSLNGVNTYQQGTVVQQGTVAINNMTQGNVTVMPKGVLSGIGTIGGNVSNTGFVSPGNSIGTLTIDGNYQQYNNGQLITQIDGNGASSVLNIIGSATLGGGVSLISTDGVYNVAETYLILTANGGLNNTKFNYATSINPMIIPVLGYTTNSVFTNLKQNIEAAAITNNQLNVGIQLDSIINPTGDELTLINSIVSSSIQNAQESLDSLAGEQYTYLFDASQYTDDRFGRRIYTSVRDLLLPSCCCQCCSGFEGWGAFEGGRTFADGDSNAKGLKGYNWDGNIGAHYVGPGCLFGLAAGYGYDRLNFNERGSANIDTVQGALYGAFKTNAYYVFSNVIVSGSRAHLARPILIALQPERKAKSHTNMLFGDWYAEVGKDMYCGCLIVQPFFGLDVGLFRRNHCKESGAFAANLEIHKKSTYSVSTFLGAHLTGNFNCLNIGIDLAWQHRCNAVSRRISANFTEFGSTFDIEGSHQSYNGLRGAIIVSQPVRHNLDVFGEFSGEYWKNWSTYNFAAGLNFWW